MTPLVRIGAPRPPWWWSLGGTIKYILLSITIGRAVRGSVRRECEPVTFVSRQLPFSSLKGSLRTYSSTFNDVLPAEVCDDALCFPPLIFPRRPSSKNPGFSPSSSITCLASLHPACLLPPIPFPSSQRPPRATTFATSGNQRAGIPRAYLPIPFNPPFARFDERQKCHPSSTS
jgi:hypothetical protein